MTIQKIIAANITNLTDARYFAAQDVGFLLFDLDELPLRSIVEMREWIAGPAILLLCSEKSLDFLEEAILKLHPVAIGSRESEIESKIRYLESHVTIFSVEPDKLRGFKIFLDTIEYVHCQGLKEVIKTYSSVDKGLILEGNLEEATGLQSYLELDKIFQWIQENTI